jgi:glutathione S-transferase
MIKLYGVPRSRAMRCLWMLEELGVPYELVSTSFLGDNKKPEYLKLNPNGRIPTLVDGSTVLWESMAINLYLSAKYGGALEPKTLEDRARAVQWSFWVMTETEKPLIDVLFHRVILPEDQRQESVARHGEETLQAPLAVLAGALEGRQHLLGDAFSVADLNVASVFSWARMSKLELSAFPGVGRWLDRCLDRPAAAKARAIR